MYAVQQIMCPRAKWRVYDGWCIIITIIIIIIIIILQLVQHNTSLWHMI